ncbi:MAG: SIMPL domain-containing protein [archaeon]|nr:SIMPL domain-containing protein [archaeon]
MKFDSKVLGVSIVFAALLIVAGIAFLGSQQPPATLQQEKVNLPGYLEKGFETTGSVNSAPAQDVISFAEDEAGDKVRLLSVTGQVIKTVSPDQAEITISIETLDKSAKKSQQDNAELAAKVMAALKAAGVPEADIQTTGYNLYEEQQWNELSRKSESIGYRTTNSVLVTLKNLGSTGDVIDAAVDAGANSISGVRFSLSNAKQDELRTEALKEAAQNAKVKADSIASGLGVTLFQVYSASENSGYSTPYYYKGYDLAVAESDGAARAPTSITPGDVEFTASVSVQFEIR